MTLHHDETLELDFINLIKKNKNYKSKPWLLKHCWKFKSTKDFIAHLQGGDYKKTPALPDYVNIYGIPFTMEEYDCNGQQVVYANRSLSINLVVEHTNRYKEMADVKSVELQEACSYRNDITYLE